MDNLENELAIIQIITCPDGGGAEVPGKKIGFRTKK